MSERGWSADHDVSYFEEHADTADILALIAGHRCRVASMRDTADFWESYANALAAIVVRREFAALPALHTETAQQSTPRTVPGEAAEASDG